MPRTTSTSAGAPAPSSSARLSRSTSTVPGTSRTAGSMSRGSARSSRNSGAGPALGLDGRDELGAEDQLGGAGARDDEVDVGQLGPHRLHRDSAPADVAASRSPWAKVRFAMTISARPSRASVVAVSALIEPAPTTRARRPASGAELGAGVRDADPDQRAAGLVDRGLGAGPLADPQRVLDELVQDAAGGAGLLRQGQRGADLTDDLALADDHRVQPARDAEQVLDRAVLVVHVQVRGQLLQPEAGVPGEQLGDVRQAAVELLDDRVDLDPVAGRQDDDLGHVLGRHRVRQELGQRVAGEGRALQQADRARSGGTARRRGRSCLRPRTRGLARA